MTKLHIGSYPAIQDAYVALDLAAEISVRDPKLLVHCGGHS